MDILGLIGIMGISLDQIIAIVVAVVALARIIVKITPTPKDDAIFAKVYAILKHIGLDDTQVIPEVKDEQKPVVKNTA